MDLFVWDLWLGFFGSGFLALRSLAWDLWLGIFGSGCLALRSLAWDLWLGISDLGSLAWYLWLGISGLGSLASEALEAGGTGLLRLGEPLGGNWGNPAGPPAAPAFKLLYKNPLGKPS